MDEANEDAAISRQSIEDQSWGLILRLLLPLFLHVKNLPIWWTKASKQDEDVVNFVGLHTFQFGFLVALTNFVPFDHKWNLMARASSDNLWTLLKLMCFWCGCEIWVERERARNFFRLIIYLCNQLLFLFAFPISRLQVRGSSMETQLSVSNFVLI